MPLARQEGAALKHRAVRGAAARGLGHPWRLRKFAWRGFSDVTYTDFYREAPVSGKPASPDDTIELPFVFVPDGQAMPDSVRHFRDPIILRARFEPDGGEPAAIPAPQPLARTLPGSAAPTPTPRPAMPRRASVAPTEPDDPEALPLLILSATGAMLAQGSPAQLAGQALRLAQLIPKTHPVFLAAAGTVLVFASLAALMEYLSPMVGDRNAGLPAPLRAKSERARTSAAVLDRDVVERLDPNEWSAHHFIGVQSAQLHTALLSAAARVGWHMDAPENVIALPRTRAAQAKLAAAGINLPVHDHGHPEWNLDVRQHLSRIEQQLGSSNLIESSESYAQLANRLLKDLQAQLRQRALRLDRITQDGTSGAGQTRQT